MKNEILEEIIKKVDLLTTEEQLSLIAALAEKARASTVVRSEPLRRWSDLMGMLSYPACGEDAQGYISHSRRESDEKRLADTNR
jgi:hypothetical protein